MKSFLIIGAGRFGKHLAIKLAELDNEVMVIDENEARLTDLMSIATSIQVGDCMDEKVIDSLGVGNFDVCFVCIGENFQASLEVTSQLKEKGAKHVVAKASKDIQAKFLLRNGADEVVYPERDMARRVAVRYNAANVFEYVEISPDYSISEIRPLQSWIGKSLREVEVRSKYGVHMIAYKRNGHIMPLTHEDYVFNEDEHLLLAGTNESMAKILAKK